MYRAVWLIQRAVALTACAALVACASGAPQMMGAARAPIAPEQVVIYPAPPANYEKIAILTASSKSAFTPGGQKSIDKVVEKLKDQAAKLGANGLILQDFSDRQSASIGTGVGSQTYTHNASVGVGVGGGVGIFKKTGQGVAIYVPRAN
ncbi:MAG TPA: hypothetical protein VGI93_21520 [Steroidobacteraceae bacterium]